MCLDSWQKSPQAFGHDHGLQVLHLHPLVLWTKRIFEEMSPAWPEPRYGARQLQLLSPLLGVWSKSVTCPLHISPLKWRGHLLRGPTSQDCKWGDQVCSQLSWPRGAGSWEHRSCPEWPWARPELRAPEVVKLCSCTRSCTELINVREFWVCGKLVWWVTLEPGNCSANHVYSLGNNSIWTVSPTALKLWFSRRLFNKSCLLQLPTWNTLEIYLNIAFEYWRAVVTFDKD